MNYYQITKFYKLFKLILEIISNSELLGAGFCFLNYKIMMFFIIICELFARSKKGIVTYTFNFFDNIMNLFLSVQFFHVVDLPLVLVIAFGDGVFSTILPAKTSRSTLERIFRMIFFFLIILVFTGG